MGIPPGARVYLTTVISLAGVALATWFGMQAGAAAVDRPWWALGAVAASVTAVGVPAYEQIRKERMRARAQRAAVDAAVAMRVTMNDALDPIVRQLGRVATAGKHEREALARQRFRWWWTRRRISLAPAGAGLPVPVRARHAEGAGSRSVQRPRGRSAGNRSPRARRKGIWFSA